ncbi:hypothetical protein OKA04_09975 [Luteolibacter flavescens]|uniref:Uncharacterized protein n=1 Tax=Luteolibacter flavescens TaxID=1859460 RepID=A0ABT3FNB1_9BACT|nr:hypothetical protein [Luteolibacter flavescens]MCW1885054.1 hypothetical protein [Luteolibacter flavescens]
MDDNLTRYLNDHLGGSAGAIGLIRSLAASACDTVEAAFFNDLERKVESDRTLLKDLISRLGESSSAMLEVAGSITGAASRLKLNWDGMEPGYLGRFEGMEVLALGIQGKRLLWVILAELAPFIPEWEGVDFAKLELDAIEQRDAVEDRRMEAGVDAMLEVTRRHGIVSGVENIPQ